MRLSVKRRPIYCGQAAAGDFPDSPHDNWAVAVAYRELIQRVRRILNKDPNAVIPEARVDHAGNRVVPWQPGDETLRPEVIRRLRAALTLGRAAPGGTYGPVCVAVVYGTVGTLSEGVRVERWMRQLARQFARAFRRKALPT